MSLILPANSLTGGYEIDNSLRFNSGSNDYLSKTYGTNGDRRLWTFSTWVKRSDAGTAGQFLLGSGDSTPRETSIYFVNNSFQIEYYTGANYYLRTSAVYRDVSAWYHLVAVWDTDNATSSERLRLYVNGERITSFSSEVYPPINLDSFINSTLTPMEIGRYWNNSNYFNGYMSETYFIDGQALSPTDFGEFDQDTGIWIPKKYTGTYGTNGFYLDFENSGSLGADQSGNGNNFTVNNLTSIDQVTDSPTNNFATMNPLASQAGSTAGPSGVTFSNGNLDVGNITSETAIGNIGVDTGKWY